MKKNFWKNYFEVIAMASQRAKENPSESYVVVTAILFGWIFILTAHEPEESPTPEGEKETK